MIFGQRGNTATGTNALYSNTTGYFNTATGYYALVANTTGSYNTANGTYALYNNIIGYNNTAMQVLHINLICLILQLSAIMQKLPQIIR